VTNCPPTGGTGEERSFHFFVRFFVFKNYFLQHSNLWFLSKNFIIIRCENASARTCAKPQECEQIGNQTMGASKHLSNENSNEGSKTYIEFNSSEENQRAAYRLASRGGQLREGIDDIDEFFAEMVPHVAKHLFEDDSIDLMEWMELDEDDLEEYREEVLESDD